MSVKILGTNVATWSPTPYKVINGIHHTDGGSFISDAKSELRDSVMGKSVSPEALQNLNYMRSLPPNLREAYISSSGGGFGSKMNFMDSFKPATFKRSFNSAMDLLSTPAKIATTLTGTGAIFNPILNHRLEHKGRISSMLGSRNVPTQKITQKKMPSREDTLKMKEHSKGQSPSHIRHMTKLMMDGKSFEDAHEETKRIEGGSLIGYNNFRGNYAPNPLEGGNFLTELSNI